MPRNSAECELDFHHQQAALGRAAPLEFRPQNFNQNGPASPQLASLVLPLQVICEGGLLSEIGSPEKRHAWPRKVCARKLLQNASKLWHESMLSFKNAHRCLLRRMWE